MQAILSVRRRPLSNPTVSDRRLTSVHRSCVLPSALLALAFIAPAQTPATQPQRTLPIALIRRLAACTADQLLVSTDGEDGDFNGMSQSGTLIILRNNGAEACRLLPLARATLLDKDGKPLGPFATAVPGARGMHPGPVVLPVAVAAGAELTATMRWVSGPVYDDTVCLDPFTLVLSLGELTLKTPLEGHLCGDRTKGVFANLSRFAPDPVVAVPGQQ